MVVFLLEIIVLGCYFNFNNFSFETFLLANFLFKERTGTVQTLLGGKSWLFKKYSESHKYL